MLCLESVKTATIFRVKFHIWTTFKIPHVDIKTVKKAGKRAQPIRFCAKNSPYLCNARPCSGLKVSTRVFQEISMCAIFFSIMLPFLGKAFKAFKSLNRLT